MPLVAAYYRPDSLDEALSLLAEANRIPLAGGTVVNRDRDRSELEVVDLQSLGLDTIEPHGDRVRIGATTSLAAVADDAAIPVAVRSIARRETPSALRTLATVGGSIATADPDSLFLAVLLVHDAHVTLAAAEDTSLADLLDSGVPAGALITAVEIETSGRTTDAVTGRTPADTPIVGAVARQAADGVCLALTGVAPTPVLVDAADPTNGLAPPDDFRGTSAYRLHLVSVLATRAQEDLR